MFFGLAISPATRFGLQVTAMLFVAGYLVSWGDRHGFNAHRIAAMQREIDATNDSLKTFAEHDFATAATADSLREEGYQAAVALLNGSGKCLVTPVMAQAFARLP